MSKRSASRASTKGPGSIKSGTKSTSGKKSDKPEACTLCTKPNKSLRILECNHGFCPTCLKQIVKEPDDKSGGKASKGSQRGGRKSAAGAVKEEYECPKCNPVMEEEPPPPPEPEEDYGECAPCKFEDKESAASGFCVECCELLCESCCSEHNKFKTIRAHNILKGDKIPKDTGAVGRLPLLMMCMTHTEKDLEYYCSDHDVMACSACVNLNHRRCERVMFIRDIVDEPTDRKVVADAAVELRDVRKNFEDIHRDTGEIIASLENQRDDIRERRENYRNQIIAMLDKLDTSSELEMEEVIQKVGKDVGDDKTSSTDILSKIDSSISMLDAAAVHATDQQMFVAGRRSDTDRVKYVNILNGAMGSIQNVRLDYKPDPTMERLLKSLELFDGRCITSSNTRHGQQKPKNTFQPRNGYIERPQIQQMTYAPHNVQERPASNQSDPFPAIYVNPREESFPVIRSNSLMTGSVPDFRSAGLRGSMGGSVTDLQSFNGRQSMPQSPRSYDGSNIYQQASTVSPSPKRQEISRTQLRAGTNIGHTSYDRQIYNQEGLPLITPRGTQSEPGYAIDRQQQQQQQQQQLQQRQLQMQQQQQQQMHFNPASPRTVGNNSLVNQGLNQPARSVSRADLVATNRQTFPRRDSLASITSSRAPEIVDIESIASRATRSDIITQASPIKRRSELHGTLQPYRERKAVLAGTFNIRLKEDSNVCGLKGAVFLNDGRIALADYDNHNVKLFDSKLYRGTPLKLSSGPWDIVLVGQKEMAVTLPFESKIQFISISEPLKPTRAIKMDMDCYGLVCRNQELIVVCNDYLIGPAVQILSLTGRVKQTIDMDRTGQRILSDPYYLTVTPTGKLIYVSDKDRIVCMDRHGNVTSVYQEPSLRNARGIDLDGEGNLYVCGYMSNNVHQITMHGIDFRCLIKNDEVWDPWSVSFNESSGTLLVTCDASDTVKVFSLQ